MNYLNSRLKFGAEVLERLTHPCELTIVISAQYESLDYRN